MATTVQRPRADSPHRWQSALERAISEGIEVRQLAGCGGWIATSGTQAGTAYELLVTGNVAHGCSCPAGANDDPVCKHRARWYFAAGVLDLDDERPAARVYTGNGRTVTVVERKGQPGTFDIIDYAKMQKLGMGGSLDFILDRLNQHGYTPSAA